MTPSPMITPPPYKPLKIKIPWRDGWGQGDTDEMRLMGNYWKLDNGKRPVSCAVCPVLDMCHTNVKKGDWLSVRT